MHCTSNGPFTIARLLPSSNTARPLIRGIRTQAEGADYLDRVFVGSGSVVLLDRDGHIVLRADDDLMADAAFRLAN